ncbi:hypothetical protein DL89DRAFT_135956 [Linderina pennispora]|uniref:Uncharacterized protein n=1 Tax=Linderina pennispora TaxID=61395 RepID=A0A1Y1WB47_9FUNG|nr:uncharacterized protein DL89DRAFT_135956 [Linderina pennispora]ORX70548.1 hypothetical protein DL89DRAFT_135956 [Linderina pennispora]
MLDPPAANDWVRLANTATATLLVAAAIIRSRQLLKHALIQPLASACFVEYKAKVYYGVSCPLHIVRLGTYPAAVSGIQTAGIPFGVHAASSCTCCILSTYSLLQAQRVLVRYSASVLAGIRHTVCNVCVLCTPWPQP